MFADNSTVAFWPAAGAMTLSEAEVRAINLIEVLLLGSWHSVAYSSCLVYFKRAPGIPHRAPS